MVFVFIPPPTIHTSTWSLSLSMVDGSKESSAEAIHRLVLTENNLAGCNLAVEAAHCSGNLGLLVEKLAAVRVLYDIGVRANDDLVVVRARRPGILTGADIAMCVVDSRWRFVRQLQANAMASLHRGYNKYARLDGRWNDAWKKRRRRPQASAGQTVVAGSLSRSAADSFCFNFSRGSAESEPGRWADPVHNCNSPAVNGQSMDPAEALHRALPCDCAGASV